MCFKIGFVNNTDEKVDLDFEYEIIENSGININNVDKSELCDCYDFILILEKDDE